MPNPNQSHDQSQDQNSKPRDTEHGTGHPPSAGINMLLEQLVAQVGRLADAVQTIADQLCTFERGGTRDRTRPGPGPGHRPRIQNITDARFESQGGEIPVQVRGRGPGTEFTTEVPGFRRR